MKRARAGLAGLLLALLLAGCARDEAYEQQSYVFGTLVTITVYGESEGKARGAASQVLAEYDRLHRELHAWQPGPLADLNRALAEGREATVSPELAALIRDAGALSERSGGLFNPAIGGLVGLWGFHSDEFKPRLPDPAAVARLVQAAPRMADITVSGERVSSRNPAVQLDLGGYAKGYALDRGAALLRAAGVRNALLNVGGNVMALGRHGDRPWRIGIQHPRKAGPMAVLDLADGEALGTSGDYQRYFELDGRRYCHLIDPRDGQPARLAQAATVLAPPGPGSGALSDAASKPLFIAGAAGWRDAARALGVEAALLVDEAGTVHVTRVLARRLSWTDKDLRVDEQP